jgi:hypothetical protein
LSADELQLGGQAAMALLQLLIFGVGIVVYLRLLTRIEQDGGQVRATSFDLPDLLMSIVFASAFGGLAVKVAMRQATEDVTVRPDQVVQSGLFLAMMLAGIVIFLHVRGLLVVDLFGLRRLGLLRAIGWSALLIVSAFPFITLVNLITFAVLKGNVVRQPLVEFFRDAAERGDYPAMASVAATAIIIAPLCEEFLFRGYFYGVGKRYVGPWISGTVTALMFAAYHTNLASLPCLTLLAIALTLAYERTGSLWVPIGMHAIFNATSLGVLYAQGSGMLPP